MDRSIAKILCLPFFDVPFKDVLRDLKLDRVEFWMALDDGGDESPDQKIANVLPALTSDQDVVDALLGRSEMINTLASLVFRSSLRVRDEIAIDLGYGSAEVFLPSGKRALDPSPLSTSCGSGREEEMGSETAGYRRSSGSSSRDQ